MIKLLCTRTSNQHVANVRQLMCVISKYLPLERFPTLFLFRKLGGSNGLKVDGKTQNYRGNGASFGPGQECGGLVPSPKRNYYRNMQRYVTCQRRWKMESVQIKWKIPLPSSWAEVEVDM
jgi:hypothetical protein